MARQLSQKFAAKWIGKTLEAIGIIEQGLKKGEDDYWIMDLEMSRCHCTVGILDLVVTCTNNVIDDTRAKAEATKLAKIKLTEMLAALPEE